MGRDTHPQSKAEKLFRKYWIELIALLAAIVGLFLMIFKQASIKYVLTGGYLTVTGGALKVGNSLLEHIQRFDLSQIAGWFLFIAAGVFVAWRARVRIMESRVLVAESCPRCGSPIMRIHRTALDHFWCSLTRIEWRRYRCENHTCRWTGLRRRRHHHEHEGLGVS